MKERQFPEQVAAIDAGRRRFCRAGFLSAAAAGVAFFFSFTGDKLEGEDMAQSSLTQTSGDSDEQRIADLVTANHILFDQGVVDGFGHVSVRCARTPAHFWLSQSRAPGIVSRDDIMEFNEDSEPAGVEDKTRPLYLERFIHGEIYRARPDVISVVHSHARGVIPFSVTGASLRPVIHTAGFLPPVTPIFEIREVAGDDNGILVANNKIAAGLTKVLGKSPVVLMRGHGDTVVGPSVKAAVYRAIYTEVNAQIQAQSLMLGQGHVVYLNPMESAKVSATNESAGLQRVWQIWEARAKANLAALKM